MKTKLLSIACVFMILLISERSIAQSPNYLWANSAGGTAEDDGYCVATDASGNVVVAGIFYSPTITFGSITLTNNGLADIYLVKYDTDGDVLWAINVNGNSWDGAYGVTIDDSGNILVTGFFDSYTISFGGITLTKSGSNSNVFIAKYDPSGNILWAKSAGGISEGRGICSDHSGNVFVTGDFEGLSTVFGTDTLRGQGYNDSFIVKYDSSGNEVWATNGIGLYSLGYSIASDINGNIVVAGHFTGTTAIFGTDTLTHIGGTSGGYDVFLVKYDTYGNALWAKKSEKGGYNEAEGVSTDTHGNIFITGEFSSPEIIFGSDTLTNSGSQNIFLAKYDVLGNEVWAKKAEGNNGFFSEGIATDTSNNVLITGCFNSHLVTFGTETLTGVGTGYNIFIAKYDLSGNVLWVKTIGGGTGWNDLGCALATDANNNVFVTGYFENSDLTFGSTILNNMGGADIFITKLDNNITGVAENNNVNNSLTVYPNPATNDLTLKFENQEAQDVLIEVKSVLGQMMYSEVLKNISVKLIKTLDVSAFSNGVYFIKVTVDSKVSSAKFIKQ